MNRFTTLLIFLLAFTMRLLVAFAIHPWFVAHGYQHWSWEWNDGYDALAKNVLVGKGFTIDGTYPTASRMPLYPYLLAIILKLAGPSLYIPSVFFVQSILSALTALICYIIGAKLFDRTTGVIAGLIYTFHPNAAIYVARCATEPIYFFVIALASLLFIMAMEKPSAVIILASGLCFGLSNLVRPTALVLLPFVAAFMLIFSKDKKTVLQIVIIFLSSLPLLIPWAMRNYSISKSPIIVPTRNNQIWFYGYYFSDNFFKVKGSRLQLDNESIKLYEATVQERWPQVKNLTGIEREKFVDRAAVKLVLENIKARPLRSIFLFTRGLVLVWFANLNQFMTLLGLIPFVFLFPAFLWSTIKLLRDKTNDSAAKFLVAFVIYFDVVHAITYPHVRYFTAALFAVAPLAALPYAKIFKRIFRVQDR